MEDQPLSSRVSSPIGENTLSPSRGIGSGPGVPVRSSSTLRESVLEPTQSQGQRFEMSEKALPQYPPVNTTIERPQLNVESGKQVQQRSVETSFMHVEECAAIDLLAHSNMIFILRLGFCSPPTSANLPSSSSSRQLRPNSPYLKHIPFSPSTPSSVQEQASSSSDTPQTREAIEPSLGSPRAM